MKSRINYILIGLGGIGYYLLLYMVKVIIEGGIYADETHTNGAIPSSQLALFLLGLVLLVVGIVAFYLSFIKGGSRKTTERPELLSGGALSSLILSGMSLFIYWLAVPAIVAGFGTLALVFRTPKGANNLWVFGLVGAFAATGALVHLIVLFG